MHVLLDARDVSHKHVHLVDRQLLFDAQISTHLFDIFHVLLLVEARHVTSIEDVVDVLKLLLIDDLRVDKQERGFLVLNACLH